MTRPFARVALSALLTMGVGLAIEAPAFAGGSKDAAVVGRAGKNKKKPTIKVATTDLGKILVTTKGNTLYVFDPDGTDTVGIEVRRLLRRRVARLHGEEEAQGRQGPRPVAHRDRWRRPGRLQQPLPVPLQR